MKQPIGKLKEKNFGPQRIDVTNNFYLDEFVDPFTYFNSPDNGYSKIDPKVFKIAQLLREKKGSSIRINNWWGMYITLLEEGKTLEVIIRLIENSQAVSKWSGYRPSHCKIGSSASKHKKGEAIDPKGNQDDLYKIVLKNIKAFYKLGLRRLENPKITKGWLHCDVSESRHKDGFIRVVNLKSHAYDLPVYEK